MAFQGLGSRVKLAFVFGASENPAIYSNHPGVDNSFREREYTKYLQEKSQEEPTQLGTALLTGGTIGGLGGAILGASGGGGAGALGGGLIGAGLGAGLGALMRWNDKGNIQHSKELLEQAGTDPTVISSALSEKLYNAREMEEYHQRSLDRRRHEELLREIRYR